MLDIADNLQRALDAVPAETRELADPMLKTLIEGVELTERSLLNALEKNGVKKFDPSGEKFNPNFQQAMYEVPDASVPAGTVVQVVQAGYMIGERILRPALVGVSKGGAKTPRRSRTDTYIRPMFETALMRLLTMRVQDLVRRPHPEERRLRRVSKDEAAKIGNALHRDIAGLDPLHAGLGHVGPGFGERALGVDAAAGVLDDIGFKAALRASVAVHATQKSVARPAMNSFCSLRALR